MEVGNVISLASLMVALGVLVVTIVSSTRQAKRAASKATKDAMQEKADKAYVDSKISYVDTKIKHAEEINQKEHEMTREVLVDLKEEFKTTMDTWFSRVDTMYGKMSDKVNREINEHEHRFHGK